MEGKYNKPTQREENHITKNRKTGKIRRRGKITEGKLTKKHNSVKKSKKYNVSTRGKVGDREMKEASSVRGNEGNSASVRGESDPS